VPHPTDFIQLSDGEAQLVGAEKLPIMTESQENAQLFDANVHGIMQKVTVRAKQRLGQLIEEVQRNTLDFLYKAEAHMLRELRRMIEQPPQQIVISRIDRRAGFHKKFDRLPPVGG